jgi:membrane protease YdiL (CAAX protease family)
MLLTAGPSIAFTSTFVWAFVFGLAAVWSGGIAMPAGLQFAVNALQMLVGMSGGSASLWKINFPPNTLQTMIDKTRNVQLSSSARMLLIVVLFTEYFIRKKHTSAKLILLR